jgi:putative nucleotidyltransferase with HDIG domain
VGIKGTYKSGERITIFKAGLVLGLFNTAIVIILTFLESKLFLLGTFTDYFYPMAMAFSSGLLSSIIVLGITPFVELFGYTTDIKLLELANTDHPLLSKLALEAPGTYHHSFVVSRLAESAADLIGVNALLVKVACLYHDIGKVLKPSYFIENQDGKYNKHDKLSPHMSSLIIQSHVKEGIELAKKAQLPKIIIDLIPQHHGTSLISYFYNKARKSEDKDVENVNEQDYRYQGPRPTSKEGAIIMLADSIEATARSLEDPTPGKLKEVVDSTIKKRFTDGSIDERIVLG